MCLLVFWDTCHIVWVHVCGNTKSATKQSACMSTNTCRIHSGTYAYLCHNRSGQTPCVACVILRPSCVWLAWFSDRHVCGLRDSQTAMCVACVLMRISMYICKCIQRLIHYMSVCTKNELNQFQHMCLGVHVHVQVSVRTLTCDAHIFQYMAARRRYMMDMCVCMRIYIYIYIYIYIHTHTHTHTHTYIIRICMCIYICIYTYVCIHVCMYADTYLKIFAV